VIGESAAVTTSFLWTVTSLLFTSAGRKIGSVSVNAYRMIMALVFLAIAHTIFLGTIVPVASNGQWFWMGLSGIVGLGIGDSGLFAAYVLLGPRRPLLMMALAPLFASVGAYLMLGEVIPPLGIIGIALTLAGVIVVILERDEGSGEVPLSAKMKSYGILFALVGAIGQGVGLVLAKKGIDFDPNVVLNPLSATLMRMILGTISLWVVILLAGRFSELHKAVNNTKGMTILLAAAFLGPFLGVTLSMVSVTYAQAGVAQTLLSLQPVLIIPVVWVLYRQRTSWRGIVGALVAVLGVTILFLV
jgi:drug/metabolite transporter (DMT)-like permease